MTELTLSIAFRRYWGDSHARSINTFLFPPLQHCAFEQPTSIALATTIALCLAQVHKRTLALCRHRSQLWETWLLRAAVWLHLSTYPLLAWPHPARVLAMAMEPLTVLQGTLVPLCYRLVYLPAISARSAWPSCKTLARTTAITAETLTQNTSRQPHLPCISDVDKIYHQLSNLL